MQNPFTKRFWEAFEYLHKKGVVTSQEEFAKALDFSPNYMSLFKDGRMQVRLEHIHNLWMKFNVSLQYILTGRGYLMANEKVPRRYEELQKRVEELEDLLSVQDKILQYKDEEVAYYKERFRLEQEKNRSSRK